MSPAVFKSAFNTELERRKSDNTTFALKVRVQGQFEAKGGKPVFTIITITVDGLPDMSISQLLPAEINAIKKHALEDVDPRMLGLKK